jgi:hypothetical protein
MVVPWVALGKNWGSFWGSRGAAGGCGCAGRPSRPSLTPWAAKAGSKKRTAALVKEGGIKCMNEQEDEGGSAHTLRVEREGDNSRETKRQRWEGVARRHGCTQQPLDE